MSKAKSRRSSYQNTDKAQTTTSASSTEKATSDSDTSSTATATRPAQSAARTTGAASAEKSTSASVASRAATATRPAQSTARATSRDAAKYERRQSERQQRFLAQRRRRRNMTILTVVIVLVVLGAGSLTTLLIVRAHQPQSPHDANATAPYEEAVYDPSYPPVDNVYCDQLEQSVEHIHAHLTIWINGAQSALPQYVGIPQSSDGSGSADCYYWLHTHDSTGIIHIESPSTEPFTLGQFFDEWNTEFNSLGFPSQLLLNSGWTVWTNGKPYKGTLDSVTLASHELITIAYNSPKAKADTVYAWPAGY
jgi:hypothetical protein